MNYLGIISHPARLSKGAGLHYKARRLSVAETLAIQSLPKAFALPPEIPLSSKFKTIGNGVPYVAANGVAKTLMAFLKEIAK